MGLIRVAVLVVVAVVGLGGEVWGEVVGRKRYNIIAIVTDDQGRWACGAYGNKDVRTPAQDRLAREGALFTNAWVNTPVCSPSRVSFLTGLHGTEVGITDWITMNESSYGLGLPPETVTWPEVLREAGYATALIGKWHLGNSPQHHPTKHGYEHFYGMMNGGANPLDPKLEVNGKTGVVKGATPDLLVDEAIRWVGEKKGGAFALSLHFREPHAPYGPVLEKDSAPFKGSDPAVPEARGVEAEWLKQRYREYYAAIHSMDRNIGRLLEKLDEMGLAENTIVLFTSDHGYNIGHRGLHGKGNAIWVAGGVGGPKRPNMFDESMRVPLIVRWPGVVKGGTTVDACVTNVDTYATVLGMLGVKGPAGSRQHGRDFSPVLRGEKEADWGTEVFGQYDLHNAGIAFMRMIRTEDWKLVRHHMTDGHNELYNLKLDPGETRNVYHNPPARKVRDELQARLTAWQESIGDPVLELDGKRPIEPGPLRGE
jgi:uncharacterized sulfatase